MNDIERLMSESRAGKVNLGRVLNERDDTAAFDRCMVGGEGCKQPAIRAHCIPETALELIMNDFRVVRAAHSVPPKTPIQWLNEEPIKPINIRRFNVGRWSCRPHDELFGALDTKNLQTFSEQSMFLMVYKVTVYLTQRALHAGGRLATPMLDPASDIPQGLSQETEEYLKEVARAITYTAMRICYVKWQMDRILNSQEYDLLEVRSTMWRAAPTMAAIGMVLREGPGDRVEWYGENSYIPVWLALLPQDHGQTIITASPRGAYKYIPDIHAGMPTNETALVHRGNNWTRLVCGKVLMNATDLAVREGRYLQLSEHERIELQEFIRLRSLHATRGRKRGFPNLLDIR